MAGGETGGTNVLKLFAVTRPDRASYGEYEGCVVAAADEDEARWVFYDNAHDVGRLPARIHREDLLVREVGTAHPSVSPREIVFLSVIEE